MKNLLLSILIVFSFSSCSLLDLNDDLKKQDKLSELEVKIDVNLADDAQVIVVLVNVDESSIVDYRVVQNQHIIAFIVRPAIYKVYAFEDIDKNYKYSLDERTVGSENILIDDIYRLHNIHLSIKTAIREDEREYVRALVSKLNLDIHNGSIYNGSIVPVTSDAFSDENIKMGMWTPYKFVYSVPFGIFFENDYDESKKVVLFIHGISGAPKNFEYLVNNLDKTKYQAIYAYYPSGASIITISEYLSRVLSELKIKYDFDDIAIIAHSMGGLVSRNMINVISKNHAFIDTYITISSPLKGDRRANSGVDNSPVVMPVWKDLAYNSEFSKQLYKTPLSEKISYYLIFGIKSDDSTDGVVSIASELRLEAQKEAKVVRGYNEDHMSILSSPRVAKYIYSILDANY